GVGSGVGVGVGVADGDGPGPLPEPAVQWAATRAAGSAVPYTATSSMVPARNSFAPFHDPTRTSLVVAVAPPVSAADATCVPLTYSRWVAPSYVPTTWNVEPATTAPAGAWRRRRVPFWITVNSSRGPLNWIDQLSA